MKIKKITSQHRSDFTAIMECEHCGHTFKNNCGYHDDYYHNKVIPSMHCQSCGKDREGNVIQREDTIQS